MNRHIAERPLQLVGTIRYETRDAATGLLIPEESGTVSNIVTDVGLAELAEVWAATAASSSYTIVVGTGTTAPAVGDTALQTQVFSGAVTSQSAVNAVFTTKVFLGAGDANGNTLVEVGLKLGSILIDRALLSPTIAKTSSKTVTIQIDLTLSR